jgi:hypothetical protein
MSLDFTLDKYRDLCQAAINSQYILFLLTVRAYMTMPNPPQKCIVLRHDIDRNFGNALRMAELEPELGIQSTYYFRVPYTFKPDIIRKIQALGHEVSYHYEVLSKANSASL